MAEIVAQKYFRNYFLSFLKNAKGGRRGRSASRPAVKRARTDSSAVPPRDQSGVRDADQADHLKKTSKKMQVRYADLLFRVLQKPNIFKAASISIFGLPNNKKFKK